MGMKYSNIHPISTGLPRGGDLSPLLWLIFFNLVPGEMRRARREMGLPGEPFKDVLSADDIATLIMADTQEELVRMARTNILLVKWVLDGLGLKLNIAKTQNITLIPILLPRGVFRRRPETSFPGTKARLKKQQQLEAARMKVRLDFDPCASGEELPPRELEEIYPAPLTATIRVLGVQIDRHFTLDEHYAHTLAKAQTRQALLRRIGNTSWGVDVGVLALTADAAVGSQLRYGLTVAGGCMPPDLMDKLDTQIINAAARRVVGADRTMRIEVLHFLAGV